MSKERFDDQPALRRIQEHALGELPWPTFMKTNLYIQNEVLKEGTVIAAHLQNIRIKKDTIMVFADDAPLFNWGHPCRYFLYDAKTTELYDLAHSEFPPYFVDPPRTFQAFHEPVLAYIPQEIGYIRPTLRCPIRFPVGDRYAVLFAGASNNRHTNDLEFLYRTLRDRYNFRDDHIYCLNYDGTINYSGAPHPVVNWPGDNTPYRMPVRGKGTKADLWSVMDDLKTKLHAQDLLLIHTNNHGGYNGPGMANLVAYSGPLIFAADFATKLAELPRFRCLVAMMEQCHSGGFNAPILSHSPADMTSVASACLEPNSSIGGAQFDPFARDWIAAMVGHTPYGVGLGLNPDSDGDGKVEAKEAFNYANAVHDPYDTPTYNESSVAAGNCFLGQRYIIWWWYCYILLDALEPHYHRLPIPKFYEQLHSNVMPRLEEVEKLLDHDSETRRKEVEAKIKETIAKAFPS